MSGAVAIERNYAKYVFFAVMAACVLLVIDIDERFLLIASDHEWTHIAAFKWLLLPHGIAGATALAIGPFQFSDRLRAGRPQLHRWLGRIYVGAIVLVAAPLGMWIGAHFEPNSIYVEQYFQAGIWWLSTLLAFLYIRNRQMAQHKLWMMRSYGFCLVFVLSRVPDAWMKTNDQQLSDLLWTLVVVALVAPDLILAARDWARRRRARAK